MAKATSAIDSATRKITRNKGAGSSVMANRKTQLGTGKGGWWTTGVKETKETKVISRRVPAATWKKTGRSEGIIFGALTNPKTLLGVGGGRWRDKSVQERKRTTTNIRKPATRQWMSVRKEVAKDGLVDSRTLRETDGGRWRSNNWFLPRVKEEGGKNVWQRLGKVGIPRTSALRQAQGWLNKLEWKPSLPSSSLLKPWVSARYRYILSIPWVSICCVTYIFKIVSFKVFLVYLLEDDSLSSVIYSGKLFFSFLN